MFDITELRNAEQSWVKLSTLVSCRESNSTLTKWLILGYVFLCIFADTYIHMWHAADNGVNQTCLHIFHWVGMYSSGISFAWQYPCILELKSGAWCHSTYMEDSEVNSIFDFLVLSFNIVNKMDLFQF